MDQFIKVTIKAGYKMKFRCYHHHLHIMDITALQGLVNAQLLLIINLHQQVIFHQNQSFYPKFSLMIHLKTNHY